MDMNRRMLVLGSGAVLATVGLSMSGCATEGPVKPSGIEQKIEVANTRADHEAIATLYEQQASADKTAAERHLNLARNYKQMIVNRGGRQVNTARHCENLARIYQQAAEENLALAKEHRQMAAEMKN
ncbi:MAG: hypothetical protein WCD07_00915 [Burkholderiales bacterium]